PPPGSPTAETVIEAPPVPPQAYKDPRLSMKKDDESEEEFLRKLGEAWKGGVGADAGDATTPGPGKQATGGPPRPQRGRKTQPGPRRCQRKGPLPGAPAPEPLTGIPIAGGGPNDLTQAVKDLKESVDANTDVQKQDKAKYGGESLRPLSPGAQRSE